MTDTVNSTTHYKVLTFRMLFDLPDLLVAILTFIGMHTTFVSPTQSTQ